jgi:excisionase family DNA binding protein
VQTPELLTFDQACEALRVSRTTLYTYMRRGFPAPVRMGSRSMFYANEVRDWLTALPRTTTTEKHEARRG